MWQAINYIICSTTLSSEFYYYYSLSQMRKLRQERLINLTKKTTAVRWQSCDLIPGSLTPDPRLLTVMLPCLFKQPTSTVLLPTHPHSFQTRNTKRAKAIPNCSSRAH